MYDKLVGIFKMNNENQILFLKNKLKDIKMDKGDSIQSYFMRITQIKNDLLSIGEVVANRELTLIALGGFTRAWDVFNTTILNNDRIPSFDELLARCTQEEKRMMERDKPSKGNDPIAFRTHAKRKNNVGPRKQGQGFKQGFKDGRKGRCYNHNRFGHYVRECLTRRILQGMMTTTTTTITKAMEIKGRTSSTIKERGMLPQLDMEMVDLPKDKEIPMEKALSNLIEKKTNLEIVLGDKATYPVKGIGIAMEDKGFKVAFIDGKVHICQRTPKEAFTLGFRVEGLYQVGGSPLGAMSCDNSLQSKLWHQRFAHLLYKALPGVRKMVTGKKIKILKTSNGTEYESNEFNDFCREVGIKRETTIAYTLEKNGVVERKNRTIMEATRTMLHDLGLPKFLWGEVANTAMYVQNRCPHQPLNFKTPEEVITSKKPDVSHFRIFGCPVYFHMPKEKRNKLGACGKKGTFVGYNENSKAYRIYVPGQRDVEVSHDVTFHEDIALEKARDLPIPGKENDNVAYKHVESMADESMPDVEGPTDPIDPPPGDPSTSKKKTLWLKDTLEDVEGHVAPRGTFRESKKPNKYQGYRVAMSTIVQFEPCTFEEAQSTKSGRM
eukprot:PITA_33904